jgi:DNA recombination protein RmuC
MLIEILAAVAALAATAALLVMLRQAGMLHRLRLLAEQSLAGTRSEAETTRAALSREQGQQRMEIGTHFDGARAMLESKLREMRDGNETKLAEIQKTVNEQLHAAVEKQMNESFNRVIDQFTAVQKAMGDVQAVTAQIGDIKRLFSNVKTRGGWGETQVRDADNNLPPGEYETNCKSDSNDAVEPASACREGRRPAVAADRRKFPWRTTSIARHRGGCRWEARRHAC